MDLELNQMVDSVANEVDGVQSFDLEVFELLILALKFPDLSELLVELLVVRVQHGGLEGQSRAAYSEDAHWQYLFHEEHFLTVVINS